MRDILFRGKAENIGMWVYGWLLKDRSGHVMIQDAENFEWYTDIDLTTVGEYTGLQDKNGKKIFEGDIVKYIPIDQGEIGVYYYYIAFEDGYFRIGGTDEYISKIYSDEWEVVGNIHDNPELLEVK